MASSDANLNIDVTADTKKAEQSLKDLQKDVQGLEKSDVEIPVGADTKKAEQALKDVKKDATELTTKDFEITLDSRVDKVLAGFDQVVAKTKETQAAADALGAALGPELAAKADTVGIVQELEKEGFTLDEITAKADQFGAKLKEVADSDVGGKLGSSLGTARGKLEEMHGEADQSRSVLANMVGNSAQDVAQLGGVAGTAGVAIGQLAEYATEANISLAELPQAAGPMIGLSLAVKLVTDIMAANAKATQVAKDNQDAWVKAINKGGDAADNYADHLRDVGKVMVTTGDATLSGDGIARGVHLGHQ